MNRDKAASHSSVSCRGCKTRYDVSTMAQGIPFSCRHCGQILYTPGTRKPLVEGAKPLLFGEVAVKQGFVTPKQLEETLTRLEEETTPSQVRIGEHMMESGVLNARQVGEILRVQGACVANRIPGYEIAEKLGAGGMGAVYKGVHLSSGKTVAIKTLAERLTLRSEFVERFHREARVAIDLDHPNIVKGFDEGAAEKIHYFVMEYVHGKSAGRVLKKRGRFGERRAMDIIRQIARALEYAHGRGIVHRDIKPDNIMITRDGKVKLADYGLVKYLDDIDVAALTTEGQIMGTPNYISPEQARGMGEIDIRSDIYSLGATLFHLMVGRPPFKGASSSLILGMHISSPTPDPRDYNSEISKEASSIILTMLSKDPAKRFQTPTSLIASVSAYFDARSTRIDVAAHSSGERNVSSGAWGPPEISTDTEFLESVGEDDKHLRKTAPMLFGVGVVLLFVAVLTAAFVIWSDNKEGQVDVGGDEAAAFTQEEPSVPAVTLSQREEDGDAELPVASDNEKEASERYRQVFVVTGAKREQQLKQIRKQYPGTAAALLSERELGEIQRRKKLEEAVRRKAEEAVKEAARRKREEAASDNYINATVLANKDRKAYETALNHVIRSFRGTEAARKAEDDLVRMRKRIALERKIREDDRRHHEQLQKNEAQSEQKEKDVEALSKFLGVYMEALRKFDLVTAKKYAELLSSDTRHPRLQATGKACVADVAIVSVLYPSVIEALLLGADRPQSLTFGAGTKLTGVVRSIRNNIVYMLVKDQVVVERSLADLSDADTERLFRSVYNKKKPAADLAMALYLFVRGKPKEAEALFKAAAKKDSFAKHHREMLLWK